MAGHRELRTLARAECLNLLGTACIGRVVLSIFALPTALPVNYVLDGETIVFRSGAGLKLSAGDRGAVVAFEVDHFDPELRMGWSVVATGLTRRLTDPSDIEHAETLSVHTWAEPGPGSGYVSIEIGSVTGRWLVPVPQGPPDVKSTGERPSLANARLSRHA